MSAMVGISLKMYMSAAQTRNWVASLAAQVGATAGAAAVEVFVLPSFPLLESTAELLQDSAIRWGAQDLASDRDGAQTGEVDGSVLRELGCTYVEVGHAERRQMFGESDAMIIDKMRQAFANELVPVLCIGETAREAAHVAGDFCVEQLSSALGDDLEHDVVVAYEPVWAIGADAPADPGHVRVVCSMLRAYTEHRMGRTHILYGGSAGPGTFAALAGSVDGLFLGRFAHDTANVAAVLDEINLYTRSAAK